MSEAGLKPMPGARILGSGVDLAPRESGRTIVTVHQPDLLPYSGFFYKMAMADRFVIAVHDQFQKHGYQRRVTMRGTWCSLQLDGKPSLVPISEVRVLPGWQERLVASIRGRYTGAKHFKSRAPELLDRIAESEGDTLPEVNVALINIVRDLLGIATPLVITETPTKAATERLIEEVTMAGGDVYIAGAGGAAYMGDDAAERFAEAGIELRWSDHKHLTGDSIVTVLMDFDDPMSAVLSRVGADQTLPSS